MKIIIVNTKKILQRLIQIEITYGKATLRCEFAYIKIKLLIKL